MYSATIDGSNTDCEYTDTIEFNVGINSSIVYDDIICVGGNTFSASFSDLDTWSTRLIYEWTTTSDLVIASPDDSITFISTDSFIAPGREQKEHTKGSLLFYIYDNGKVEKRVLH